MIILSASGLGKSYGTDIILENISFHINAGDKVGIVGANGAGKTTLLNMLTGELSRDSGDFFVAKDKTVGYLKQRDYFDSEKTVIEEAGGIFADLEAMEKEINELNHAIANTADEREQKKLWDRLNQVQNTFERKGGFTFRSELTGILTSMGFGEDAYHLKTGSLSGGEKTRLALACLLMQKPDILMLDEPTNHLDINTLKWLEQYLKNYSGTVVLISHDRYFLDSIVDHIFDVEDHGLKVYAGNYTEYVEKKRAAREAEERAYSKQQTEIRRQEDLIRSYKERGTEKLAKRAKSREKRLAHVERLDKPKGKAASMKIDFPQKFQSGSEVLTVENLSYGYSDSNRGSNLFNDVNMQIKRGEKICIIGDNGTGKTTLLKVLMGELTPNTGYVKFGHNVDLAYYDQGQLLLNDNLTVMDEVHNDYRLYTDGEIRNILGRFLFRGDKVFNLVGGLSGGEKARLTLLKLMMTGANLLILDEPTNHLDIQSKEAFEEALMDYPGTVITVTHDRYFLNRIPDRILELSGGTLRQFLGKYDYYIEKKTQLETGASHMRKMADGASERDMALSGSPGSLNMGSGSGDAARSGSRNALGSDSGDGLGNDLGSGSENSGPQLSAREERELKKQKEAEERRIKREMANLMDHIEELEHLIEQGEAELCAEENLRDIAKLQRISQEVADWKADLDTSYNRWMELAEQET